MASDNRPYCIYLRKSRKDLDAERNGVDTLSRHENILLNYAKQNNLIIGQTYREVVSGDTIAARPEMQKLLSDVEQGLWKGVLVVEVERLARGDTIDQGIISQVFKFSETLIVTPFKTYDPNNEFDEEFFEYGLFQSRREYKAITRRQRNGVKQSVAEGKWPYNKAPFGYERYKLSDQKGWSLRIIPEEARIIKTIFEMYASGEAGYIAIIDYLNDMHAPAPNGKWTVGGIQGILRNITYTGKVKYGARSVVKKTVNGVVTQSRPRSKEFKLYEGLHEAIIPNELFDAVQNRLNTHVSKPVASGLEIRNPLAGLLYCKKCGHKMVRRPQDRSRTMIICPNRDCDNISSYETVLEEAVIESLTLYLDELKLEEEKARPVPVSNISILEESLAKIDKEIETLNQQLDNAFDLVEQGVYSSEMFLKRNQSLTSKIEDCNSKKEDVLKKIKNEERLVTKRKLLIPKIENVLNLYDTLEPAGKNALLSEIIDRIDYIKTERSKKNGPYNNFNIDIHPHVPL